MQGLSLHPVLLYDYLSHLASLSWNPFICKMEISRAIEGKK